ncbi:MAG TPA: PTS glucitol/sorbitol transporter subunit IIA, partial [Bacilli bacterium]
SEAPAIMRENILILFDIKAPKELQDVAVVHENSTISGEIRVGDTLIIDSHEFSVTFVGNQVHRSLQELGHVSFKFSGEDNDLPGTVCVENKEIPPIIKGTRITVVRK